MSIRDIPASQLSEAILLALVTTGVPESPTIDYKRDTYGTNGEATREFLKDVSAFANTLGGDIIIGIDEEAGLPVAITPLTINADAEVRRLTSITLNGLEPRITDLQIRAIPVQGGNVIIVRVPRSFNGPHRVIAQGSNSFWARAGTQRYEPNVAQLRQLFIGEPLTLEKIRSFHADRLVKVASGETPFALQGIGKLCVHVVPLPAFADGRLANVVTKLRTGNFIPIPLDFVGVTYMPKVNLDGFLNTSGAIGTQVPKGYVQFFRNGTLESVTELRTDDQISTRFIMADLTSNIVSRIRQYLDVLQSYEAGSPIYVFVSFCNASKIYFWDASSEGGWIHRGPLEREIVSLPEVYVDRFDVDVIDALQDTFDTLWNAFGLTHCPRYDDLMRWKNSDPYALRWR